MIGPSSALLSCVLLSSAEQLPEYPGTILTEVGEGLLADGVPQRLAYFVTSDSVETVADYFYRRWLADGQLTLVDGDFEQALMVSAFSTIDAVQRAVILRSQGRMTVGFSVVRALRFERPPLTLGGEVEGRLFAHGLVSGAPPLKSSHRTILMRSSLANARRNVIEQLKGSGCKGLREGSMAIESICPDGQVRTLLIEESLDLTAVFQTLIDANASPEGEPR